MSDKLRIKKILDDNNNTTAYAVERCVKGHPWQSVEVFTDKTEALKQIAEKYPKARFR